MNSILESLYIYAMESDKNRYLDKDELRDYRSAARSIEKAKDQLEHLLEGETLRLFKLYDKNRNEEELYEEFSTFRKGLAMGIRLGSFAMPEKMI